MDELYFYILIKFVYSNLIKRIPRGSASGMIYLNHQGISFFKHMVKKDEFLIRFYE